MKRCPECRRDYYDDTMLYCLDDGAGLLEGPATLIFDAIGVDAPTIQQMPLDWERMNKVESVQAEAAFDRRYQNLAPLIGRGSEVAAITELLTGRGNRLVTLTGIGGTGKTRLSIEVARMLRPHFPDGVFLIELSAIDDADMVTSAIAHTIGIVEAGRPNITESLGKHLRERCVLLVLDNMEQVLEAGVHLSELLQETSGVKMLVTSRAPLGLSVETEYRLTPLDVPRKESGLSISDLMACESVHLFVARAKQAWSDFELTDDNSGAVSAICRKLDGLPLALELAAARAKVLSPGEIHEKLENSLTLLTGGSRDMPGRQQTMRGAIAWSYELLNAREKQAFWQLSVFEGSFTFGQAEKIIGAPGVNETDILDVVTSLAEKSLLLSERGEQSKIRFRMLQLVREFSIEILRVNDADGSVRRAHAAHFLALAEEASPHLDKTDSAEWLQRLEMDHDNFRAAIRWSLADNIESAARLMAGMRSLWVIHGHIREGRHWFERALDKGAELSPELRWELLTGLGNMAQFQGDYQSARDAYFESLQHARTANSKKKIARSLRGLGAVEYIQGELTSARARIIEAIDISRSLGDDFGIAACLSRFGDIAVAEGKPDEGLVSISESLDTFRKLGYKVGILSKLNNLATAELLTGDTENARVHFVESIKTSKELGDRINARITMEGFAALMYVSGEFRNAALFCGAGAALGDMMGIELEPVEQRLVDFYIDGVREAMGENEFAEAVAEGRRMNADDAIEFALQLQQE